MVADQKPRPEKEALDMLVRGLGSAPLHLSHTEYIDIWDCKYPVKESCQTERVSLYWGDTEVQLENTVIAFDELSSQKRASSTVAQIARLIAERGEPDRISYHYSDNFKEKPISEIPYEDGAPDRVPFQTVRDETVEGTFAFSEVSDAVLQNLRALARHKGIMSRGTSIVDLATIICVYDKAQAVSSFLMHLDKAPFSFYESGSDESERYRRASVTLTWDNGETRQLKGAGYSHERNVVLENPVTADPIRVQIKRLVDELGEPAEITYSYSCGGVAGNCSAGPNPPHKQIDAVIPFSEVRDRILSE